MITKFGTYFFAFGLFFLLGCKTQRPSARIVLFEADWCAPCKKLKADLAQAHITSIWRVKLDRCEYEVSVDRIDMTDAAKTVSLPDSKHKKSDAFPEQAFLWKEQLLANDNYSDMPSVD